MYFLLPLRLLDPLMNAFLFFYHLSTLIFILYYSQLSLLFHIIFVFLC